MNTHSLTIRISSAILIGFAIIAMSIRVVYAADFPTFATDEAADQWLRERSAYYRMMSDKVQSLTGYAIRTADISSPGDVKMEGGKLIIRLNGNLTGAKRVSILIFELTNCYQHPQHREIDEHASRGLVSSAREFGLLHELVEMDGLRHHRMVLEDLDLELHGIPAEMIQWINPKLTKLGDYNLPFAYDHIKAQEAGGHTKHYWEWYPKQSATKK